MKLSDNIVRKIESCKGDTLKLGNDLFDDQLPKLVELIKKKNPPILYLHLSDNNFTDKITEQLTDQVTGQPIGSLLDLPLKFLGLTGNALSNKGAIEIITRMPTLRSLDLSNNLKIDAGIIKTVEENMHFVHLDLKGTKVPFEIARDLAKKIQAYRERSGIKRSEALDKYYHISAKDKLQDEIEEEKNVPVAEKSTSFFGSKPPQNGNYPKSNGTTTLRKN